MFDISFADLFVLGTAALVVLGPKRLPATLREIGPWIAKARRFATTLSSQSGIDEMLRPGSTDSRVNELRSLRQHGPQALGTASSPSTPFVSDKSREYPVEGPDAQGALAEDLLIVTIPELVVVAHRAQ